MEIAKESSKSAIAEREKVELKTHTELQREQETIKMTQFEIEQTRTAFEEHQRVEIGK